MSDDDHLPALSLCLACVGSADLIPIVRYLVQCSLDPPAVGPPEATAAVARAVIGPHHPLFTRTRRTSPPVLLRLVIVRRRTKIVRQEAHAGGEQQHQQQSAEEGQVNRCGGRLSDRGGRDVQSDHGQSFGYPVPATSDDGNLISLTEYSSFRIQMLTSDRKPHCIQLTRRVDHIKHTFVPFPILPSSLQPPIPYPSPSPLLLHPLTPPATRNASSSSRSAHSATPSRPPSRCTSPACSSSRL